MPKIVKIASAVPEVREGLVRELGKVIRIGLLLRKRIKAQEPFPESWIRLFSSLSGAADANLRSRRLDELQT